MRWIVYHLPDLCCAFIACYNGFPVVLGGLTSSAGRPRRSDPDAQHDILCCEGARVGTGGDPFSLFGGSPLFHGGK